MVNYFACPGFNHDLLSKISHKGVTVLGRITDKDPDYRRFKSRITGSRTHVVLPDGTLVDNRRRVELMGPQELEKQRSKKKRIPIKDPDQVPEKIPREYFVNEKLISARVYSYVLAMEKPVLHAVTISFPPCVNDDQGMQYLNNWLTVAKDTLHLRDFLRVSEYQENGTIHFHLLIPQYINIHRANRIMQIILGNQVRKKKLDWNLQAAKRYNGVDIAKDRKTKRVTNFGDPKKRRNLVAYITKYVAKGKRGTGDNPKKGFPHLAWHNSRGFSSMMTGISFTEVEAKFLGLSKLVNFSKLFMGKFFSWVPWSTNNPPNIFNRMLTIVNQAILAGPPGMQLKLKFTL